MYLYCVRVYKCELALMCAEARRRYHVSPLSLFHLGVCVCLCLCVHACARSHMCAEDRRRYLLAPLSVFHLFLWGGLSPWTWDSHFHCWHWDPASFSHLSAFCILEETIIFHDYSSSESMEGLALVICTFCRHCFPLETAYVRLSLVVGACFTSRRQSHGCFLTFYRDKFCRKAVCTKM